MPGCLDVAIVGAWPPLEVPVTATAMIVPGILCALTAVSLALGLKRITRRGRPRDPAVEPVPAPPVGKRAPTGRMAGFPAAPVRFVGRAEVMAAASTALAPASGRTAVVLHGVCGAGKTTCAVELAYLLRRGFVASAFWSAPTDPDQCGDALRLLAESLDEQLADHGFAMVEQIATPERLGNFLTTFTATFADAGLLLVLDNLDTLLTPDGQWRDLRWTLLINALIGHRGPSRIILTSRVMPAGLNPGTVLIRPVHPLSREESLVLIGELPHLRVVLRSVELARCVLTLTQGHPALMEFADAAAADPPRLAYQLAEIDDAVHSGARAVFLTQGLTRLDAEQLQQTFTAWTTTVASTAPAAARLLLAALCRMEEPDRNADVLDANWPALWRRWEQPGPPPPLGSSIAALVDAGLIAPESVEEPDAPQRYRIHPGVAEAIQSVTAQPFAAVVDVQLAAWWMAAVGGWGIALQHAGEDAHRFMMRASLAAARYLLRQHGWNAASCLLERAMMRNRGCPVTALAVTALLQRIAEATGAVKDLVVLGAALRRVDPGAAETALRHAYQQVTTDGDHRLASTTAGELVTLLRDQGRLREALTVAGQKLVHSRQAGFGLWTQLSDHGRRLQILHLLGYHEQVLHDVAALRTQLAGLPDRRAPNDRVNPYNVREGILDLGRLSALALGRWTDALEYNDEIARTLQRRGANPHEIAVTRFHDYTPLVALGRLTDADHVLRGCQDTFDAARNTAQLAATYAARADLENTRGRPIAAAEAQRTALRLAYVHPHPGEISTAHHHLADYLSRAAANPAEQRAHRLAAALLNQLTGNTCDLTRTRAVLAAELRRDAAAAVTPVLVADLTRLVDAQDGIRFGDLLATLCPDPATAQHALTTLLTR